MTRSVSPDLNILDESLDENRALSCKLAVQVASGHVSLAVLDAQETRYLAAQAFRFPEQIPATDLCHRLREIAAAGILSWRFQSVRLFVSNQLYTLVPAPLFNPLHREEYLRFNLSNLPGDAVYSTDRLTGLDAVTIFAVPRWLKDQLDAIAGDAPLHHAISPFIESILNRYKSAGSDTEAFVNIQTGLFDLLILHGHRVSFCNSFTYRTPEDLLYFTMFTLEQLQLTPDQVTVHVMGEIGRHAPVIEKLAAYLPHLDFMSRNESFRYSPAFEKIPGHYFYHLLNAEQCEL